MKQEWLEIEVLEAENTSLEGFEPSDECPNQWLFREDLDACVPFWTLTEPNLCETAETQCEGVFKFDETLDVCLYPGIDQ
jgi:hypothetical protein